MNVKRDRRNRSSVHIEFRLMFAEITVKREVIKKNQAYFSFDDFSNLPSAVITRSLTQIRAMQVTALVQRLPKVHILDSYSRLSIEAAKQDMIQAIQPLF